MANLVICGPEHSEATIKDCNETLDKGLEGVFIDKFRDDFTVYVKTYDKVKRKRTLKKAFELRYFFPGLSDCVEYIIDAGRVFPIVGPRADKLLVRIEEMHAKQQEASARRKLRKVKNMQTNVIKSESVKSL